MISVLPLLASATLSRRVSKDGSMRPSAVLSSLVPANAMRTLPACGLRSKKPEAALLAL